MLVVKQISVEPALDVEHSAVTLDAELCGAPCKLRAIADASLVERYSIRSGDLPFRVTLDDDVRQLVCRQFSETEGAVDCYESLVEDALTRLEAELDSWASTEVGALTGPDGPRPIIFVDGIS